MAAVQSIARLPLISGKDLLRGRASTNGIPYGLAQSSKSLNLVPNVLDFMKYAKLALFCR